MKYAYASRTGNVQSIVENLNLDATYIETGSEVMDGPYVLFTFTEGYGEIPAEVQIFLANDENVKNCKGVICSGDESYGPFCGAADQIQEQFNIPTLYKVENAGTEEDLKKIKDILSKLN